MVSNKICQLISNINSVKRNMSIKWMNVKGYKLMNKANEFVLKETTKSVNELSSVKGNK